MLRKSVEVQEDLVRATVEALCCRTNKMVTISCKQALSKDQTGVVMPTSQRFSAA